MATSLGSVTGTVTNSNTQLKGAKINVRLYETKWASGKTKVTWYVDLLGRSESPTKAKTSFKLVITLATGSKITDVTGTSYSSGSEIVSYNNNKSVLSGSCYVFHNNAGAAKITVKISDSSVGGYSANASGSFSLTNNKPFTACGAPTSVTINKSIVLPQDTIKVSWSGATAGTGNPISGYIVYYNISATGANPTTSSTKSAKLSSSTKSYEITFDAPSKIEKPIDEVRGYKIVCGVIAVGTEDGYDSSMKYSSPIVINSLPKLSVAISDEKEIIPSTGGTVTFNLSATDTNNQTLNYFYATTENAENKELATSKIEIEIKDKSPGTEIPYYFWASDGLEFSEPVRKTIMINNPPEFEVTIEGTELSSINAKTDAQYIIQPTIAINNFTKQENRTYAFSYNVISSIDKNFTESSSKLIKENTSQESISLQDIREYLENFQENGKYYRISVSCSDGIEIVTKTSDIKYVTKVPSLIGLYNKSNNSNISGYYSTSNMASYYSDYLKFAFQKDTGYSTITINNQEISLSIEANQISAIFQEKNESNTSKLISLTYSFGFEDSQTIENITKIGLINLSNFNSDLSNNLFSFFEQETQGNNYNSSLNCDIGTSINLKQANKNFGLSSSLTYNKIQLKINIDGINSSYFSAASINSSSNDTTLIFSIKKSNIKDKIKELIAFNNRNAKYPAKLILEITNDFGNVAAVSQNIVIDFVETSSINISLSNNKISLKYNESPYPLLSNGTGLTQLVEGMNLYGNFKVSSYNTINKVEVYINRSHEGDTWSKINEFIPVLSSNQNTYPIVYTVTDQFIQTIGAISREDYKVKYKIVAVTDVKDESNNFIASEQIIHEDIIVRQHVPISLEIAEGSYSTGVIKIKYNIVSQGATSNNLVFGEENIKLQFQGRENLLTPAKEPIEEDNTVIFEQTIGTEIAYVKLGASTTLNILLKEGVYFTSTKETNFDNIAWYTIFNQSPTVSYRKNYLGINTLEPDESNIITIGESQNRYQIEYVGSAQHPHCKVIKFHIDANSWDGTTGGNMGNTGGNEGNIPTNLAAIAYTGEIGDLQQVRQDIIIFTGGTAPI